MLIKTANPKLLMETYYKGTVHATYSELCETFGKHTNGSSDGKVKAEWVFVIDGTLCAVHDYKSEDTLENTTTWSVRGSLELVAAALEVK